MLMGFDGIDSVVVFDNLVNHITKISTAKINIFSESVERIITAIFLNQLLIFRKVISLHISLSTWKLV